MTWLLTHAIALLAFGQAAGAPAIAEPPSLIILADTGERRDGLPVLQRHAAPDPFLATLSRGFAGRLLRLYALEQRFAGRAVRPAYLLLSENQGGFPRFGFYLEGVKHGDTAYVDLHRRSVLSGRPGAVDQIFPHELLHIIVSHLAGDPPEGHATQVHAVGVATDRVTAFNEGFAEHAQLMAIEAADAEPATRALATDESLRARAFAEIDAYRRALTARWSVATRSQMTFPVWFSRSEQVLRYHAVRANLFARRPTVPERLYAARTAYQAYLLDNVLPGDLDGRPKSVARMLATEGVVSALFYRFVNAPPIQQARPDAGFYARFGADPATVAPLDNAYLKLFASIHAGGYDAAAVIDAYARLFPGERTAALEVLGSTMLGQELNAAPALWVVNEAATIGTSLFDQFRGMPRPHVFDLNACSEADLIGVPGVDRQLAIAILEGAPFRTLEDLRRVPGMTAPMLATFARLRAAMDAPPAPGTSQEGSLSLKRILMPYGWRALRIWLACAAAAMALYRAARRASVWRLLINGLAGSAAGLIAGWTLDGGTGLLAIAVPVALFGVPAGIIQLWRSGSGLAALRVLLAWTASSLAAAIAVVPI